MHMSTFHGLEMAKQALFAQQAALYTTGHNIANANTEGYSRQRVNFKTMSPYPAPGRNRPEIPGQMGTGVQVGTVERTRNQFLDYQFRTENSKSGYWDTKADALSRMEELLNEPSDSGLSKTMSEFWDSLQELSANPTNSGARSVVANRALAVTETFNHLSKSLNAIRTDLKNQIDVTVDRANSLLGQINQIYEPSDSGLSKTMSEFWDSLQELSANPTNSGARSVVANRALAVTETFNHLSKSLNAIRTDLKNQIDVTVDRANSLLGQINQINEQVKKVEPHGYLPNDLYDERDRLIDELSQIMNIEVTYSESSNSSLDIGQGIASIEMVSAEGKSLQPPVFLIERNGDGEPIVNKLELTGASDVIVNSVEVGTESIGTLSGLIESYDKIYPEMLDQLDRLAYEFAVRFNVEHAKGFGFDSDGNPVVGQNFFDIREGMDSQNYEGAVGLITVDKDIVDNLSLIAASTDGTSGNGDHAQALADFFSDAEKVNLDGKSVNSYFESIIGKLGVEAQEANRNADNTSVLRSQVVEQRMSVSAVSLDEEMTNMIKFQHAYNAAARSMTTIDEMLDRIINGMGLVGR